MSTCLTMKCNLWLAVHHSNPHGFLFTRSVCYNDDGIGCFSNGSPYNNAKGNLPESPAHIQVYLFVPDVPKLFHLLILHLCKDLHD
ncbi:hypothetical protein MAR_036533 [Mya arenaria]|uniref:Uncharacterized protein n=1 Tax=Mya arenaria TaxID=6604 RepID=A0ABY7FPQ9_MYAAR|nr:hypothetical protein MAR_036533 [Mya arenaria]